MQARVQGFPIQRMQTRVPFSDPTRVPGSLIQRMQARVQGSPIQRMQTRVQGFPIQRMQTRVPGSADPAPHNEQEFFASTAVIYVFLLNIQIVLLL